MPPTRDLYVSPDNQSGMTDSADGGLDRRSFLGAAGTAAAVVLAGCTGGDDGDGGDGGPTGEPQSGGTLRVGYEAALTGLDPHRTSSVVSWNVIHNVCEGLLTFEDEVGTPVGRLVTDYEVSADGLEYRFTLAEGTRFHPPVDRELTAEDVVYSYERMRQPEAMGSDLAALETVEATGRYEVTMRLSTTFAPLLSFLARVQWVVVPEEAVEAQGGGLGDLQEPVGTGPFRIGDYEQGVSLELVAFEDYREEGLPYLDRVLVEPVPDADSRVSALRGGDIDAARGVPGNTAEVVAGDARTRLVRQRDAGWAQVHINCSREPWSNPAVRRAVAHVLDRESVVQAGVFGYGEPAWQPYPEDSVWHHDLGDTARETDVDRARELLAAAGDPLEDETLQIETNTRYPVMEATADLLVAALNEAGIDAETRTLEWGTQLSDFVTGNFGAMAFEVPYKVDPDRHYYGFIHPSSTQWNQYGPDQPDAERMYELVQRGRDATDREERVAAYREFQRLVNRNVPWISVARTDGLLGLRSTVGGYRRWLLPYDRYWTMWLAE